MSDLPVLAKPPSQAELRAELEAMVIGDLLGPAGGESEELTERTVRDRYIVGVLAPQSGRRADHKVQPWTTRTKRHRSSPTNWLKAAAIPPTTARPTRMFPLLLGHLPPSIGMTFSVEDDAKAIKVSAFWGQYKREVREDQIEERPASRSESGSDTLVAE